MEPIELSTEQDFFDVLTFDKAIIYLLVDWSGPERNSRFIAFKAFNCLDQKNTPFFKIDCSDQNKKYVVDWLIAQMENEKYFYNGGLGETLLIKKGEIVDFIKNPGQLGYEETQKKLKEWENNIYGKL